MLLKREVASFVYDAVQLEGINLTLPEVQTLLEGVTVGGHKISDQQIAINQGEAWNKLIEWLKRNEFDVSEERANALHAIAAKKNEVLRWGEFRTGGVTIAGTEYMPPPVADLPGLFVKMISDMQALDDIYDRAIHVFLTMARCQFYYDVNKRMGRFMMNGVLLNAGYPAINVPVKRKLEFNELMLKFYETGDQAPMNQFLRSCLDPRAIKIMSE